MLIETLLAIGAMLMINSQTSQAKAERLSRKVREGKISSKQASDRYWTEKIREWDTVDDGSVPKVPKEWADRFRSGKMTLADINKISNPNMRNTLHYWYHYGDYR
ncbi:MAG: hypothetical protein KME28_13225 [Pelatocladus maniniholoensis HA4357-MV3]|jgi:hypothetical protein|uniref:Uncharacterized protein n=1 Tax=Pelatocladus maniniholoensis HA4357-MV3 TaxID=1117104 RepID=A0A9E3LTJ6_9NOST|nr:hypothetical protein [Pelatocladus maniniholoensis HA4357-MV3]BAZ65534.1 hypothetical protein NIES4106_02730 [Fischerella sp. NIES-4106]